MQFWDFDREDTVEKRGTFRDFRSRPRNAARKTLVVTNGGSVGPFLRNFYRHRVAVSAPVQRFFLFLLLAGVIYAFVLGDGGAIRIVMLRHERSQMDKRIADLQSNADYLEAEIARLDSDPFYVEKTGRERYGYIRPGEKVYKLVPAKEKSK
jgi:cell division protein FtsB